MSLQSNSEKQDTYCVKCGEKNGVMASKNIIPIKKTEWDSINKKMNQVFENNMVALLMIDEEKKLWVGTV